MPVTDALQPPLTPEEREVVKSYDGWTNTMHSLGLKSYDLDDIDEAKQIVSSFAEAGKEESGGASQSK
ncbi:hypothetical protein SEPCBS119000_000674 [Sporothrix epigloea]|uniref:Uncharacterized protein n=1 Tax=Sporothrix epigloea TaxID=1892477 RepID=A0ABP0D837_9PEZI